MKSGTAKKALWMISGNGIFSACQALNLIILTRTLGIEAAGIFTLGLAICAPIMLFSNFGIRTQIVTDVGSQHTLRTYYRTRLGLATIGFATCSLLAIAKGYELAIILAISTIAFSKAVECGVDLVQGVQQKHGNYRAIAISQSLKGATGCLGLIIGVLIYKSLVAALLLYAVAWMLIYLSYDYRVLRGFLIDEKSSSLTIASVAEILKFGAPIAISSLLINFNVSIPRLVLSEIQGVGILGVYGTLAAVIQIGTLVANSIGQAVLPRLAVLYQQEKHAAFHTTLQSGALVVMLMSSASIAVCYYFGGFIVKALFGTNQSEYSFYLLVMSVGACFQYLSTFFGYVVSATRKNYNLLRVHLLSFSTSTVVSLLLIPQYGILGTIAAQAFGSVAGVLAYIYMIKRSIGN